MAVVPRLPTFIHHVGYDLRAPGKDYKPLWEYLGRIGVRALASEWLVETTLAPADLAAALARLMDANDGLLVTELPAASVRKPVNVHQDAQNARDRVD